MDIYTLIIQNINTLCITIYVHINEFMYEINVYVCMCEKVMKSP